MFKRINSQRQKANIPELENRLEQIEWRTEVGLAKFSYGNSEGA